MGNRPFRCASRRLAFRSALCINLTTMAVLGAFSLGMPMDVRAQDATVQINLPAQSLDDSLIQLGRQTDLQFFYTPQAVAGIQAPQVQGSMTPEQALQRLLQGTPVQYRRDGRNVTLSRLMTETTQLAPVTVTGSLPGALPPAYAGGQVATGGQVGMLGNKDVMDTPFSVTNYTNKTIEDQQARTLWDVLANEPSIVMSAGGTQNFWSFRGFPSQTYTGGHSLNGLPAMSPMHSPSTDWVERVEVLRGPSALLKGASLAGHGALGGSVNLVTKKADDKPLTQLTTRYMSDSQLGGHVDIGRRFGNNNEFGIRLNASYDNGQTAMDKQRAKSGTGAVNLDYRGDSVRLSTDFAYQRQDLSAPINNVGLNNVPGGIASLAQVPEVPSNSVALSPSWGKSSNEIALGMVQGEFDIIDNVTAYGAIGTQRYESFANVGSIWLLNADGGVGARSKAYRERFDVLSMLGGVRAIANTGPLAHTLSLDLSKVDYISYVTDQSRATAGIGPMIPIGTVYNPNLSIFPTAEDPGDPVKSNKTILSSIGIADTLSIFDERIQFIAGVRYQKIQTKNYGGAVSIVGQQLSYDASAWSPSFGLVLKPWENVSLYGNYIQNLQPGTSAGSNYANSGETFPPYKSKQYEAGVKVDWGSVTTTLAAFQISQPSTLSVADPQGGLPRLSLDGEQRNRGLEFNVYGEVTPSVRLLGGVTYLNAIRTKTQNGTADGTRAAGAPRWRAVLGGEWDTPFINDLTLTGRLTYTSNSVVANNAPNLTVPSWTQVDLGARYRLKSSWTSEPIDIRLGIDNVFDKSYWKVMHVAGLVYRSEPRTYRLSATMRF